MFLDHYNPSSGELPPIQIPNTSRFIYPLKEEYTLEFFNENYISPATVAERLSVTRMAVTSAINNKRLPEPDIRVDGRLRIWSMDVIKESLEKWELLLKLKRD